MHFNPNALDCHKGLRAPVRQCVPVRRVLTWASKVLLAVAMLSCVWPYLVSSRQGFVYLKFGTAEAAAAAHRALMGRWFAGRQIVAEYQFVAPYQQHFGI
jgi:hypothetical protein